MVKSKAKTSNTVISVLVAVALVVIALLCLLPVWHVYMSALTDPYELLYQSGKFVWWPAKFSSSGFKMVLSHPLVLRSYLNTIIYTLSSTALCLLLSALGAYVLSCRDFYWKKPVLILLLITMFFNGGQIPFYSVVRSLKLTDNMLGMILPTCCNALSIIMLKNGMDSLPEAFREAARIDGAGHMRILMRIVLPLTTSHLAVIGLFSFVAQWNSWVNAAMFLGDGFQNLYPLQLVMREILVKNSTSGIVIESGEPANLFLPSIQAAMVVVGSLPLILLYPFIQKFFEKGLVLGGVKG